MQRAATARSPRRRRRANASPAFAIPPPPVLLAAAAAAAAATAAAAALLLARRARRASRTRSAPMTREEAMPPAALLRADADPRCEKVARQYEQLSALQRRNLLAATIARAAKNVQRPEALSVPKSPARSEIAVSATETEQGKRSPVIASTQFWKGVEAVNGRAAAMGFLLCLMREVLEPGHPSLFEQVVDVVVPIAQKTPPFVVAVVDRLADLLT